MNWFSRIAKTALLSVGVLFAMANPAEAVFRMRIESGTTTGPGAVLTDGGNDGLLSPAANQIVFSSTVPGYGAIGSFTLNVTTGLQTPSLPAPNFYEGMDLNNVTINTGGAGTIRLILASSDFGSATPDGPLMLRSSIGGTLSGPAGSTITADSYVSDVDGFIPGLGADVLPVGALAAATGLTSGINAPTQSFGNGAFSGTTFGYFSKTGAYSMWQVVTVSFTGAGSVSFDFMTESLPEPATVVSALLGLPMVGVWWKRRQAKAALAV